nr:unnamed protein product [uncultured bacterium]
MEEKQQLVNEFAKSGLTKSEFIRLHHEYKRTTIYSWLQKYFPDNADVNDSTDASDSTKKPKDSIGKFKMVLETAKMTDVELGAYCRSNGIYASELNVWKVNCMNANNSNKESLETVLKRLIAENKLLKEKDNKLSAELKSKDKELDRMKDALAEYAVKEAFLKKAQAFFSKNNEEK